LAKWEEVADYAPTDATGRWQVTDTQPGGGPTVRRMLVGARLRRLRTDRGISREQAGTAIRASEWKIHRLENGQVGFKERDIVDLLELYGVDDPGEVATIVNLARDANAPAWWQQFGDVVPHWFRAYIDLESAATVIRAYEGNFIPELLQTEEYMRAMITGTLGDGSASELEQRVALRMVRQGLLARDDGPWLWTVLDEAALRRQVGGRKVMHTQLQRLVEIAELPNITLQVLPFSAGAHPAMASAFTILRFAEPALPDVVYVEHLTNALHLDRREDVEQYLHVMESICVRSEAPDKSVDTLSAMLRDI
jgi:Domain of unknown function (DUF5753)/Helix-turn-helix domain